MRRTVLLLLASSAIASDSRPALLHRRELPGARAEPAGSCPQRPRPRPPGAELTALRPAARATQLVSARGQAAQHPGLVKRVYSWGERHATAPWFPWALAVIGFLDPFTLCGFLITPLLTLALLASDLRWALVLCTAASAGCLAGNALFVALIGRLGMAARLAQSPQLAVARNVLQRHGPLAGVLNTLFPAPTIPLMVAAHVLQADVPAILMALALGRALRYVLLVATVFASRRGAAALATAQQLDAGAQAPLHL